MRLHITTDDTENRNFGKWFVDYLTTHAARCRRRAHTLADDPELADAVLVVVRGDEYSSELRRSPLVRRFYSRLFVYDTKDRPIPFLPGLYCSLPRRCFKPHRHAAAPYVAPINSAIADIAAQPVDEPDLFFSFIGADNAPVRRRLLRSANHWRTRSDIFIELAYGWQKRGDAAAERRFAETISRSRFVLCPRGIGTSTYRLYETMELGRVPVILSDDWVPVPGPNWERFAIQLPEGSVSDLPRLLTPYESQAADMGRAARAAWEEWFAPDIQFHRLAEAVGRLKATGRSHPPWLPWTWQIRASTARVGRMVDETLRNTAKQLARIIRRSAG